MEIRTGKYILRSDQYCFWVDEEYESKGKNGKPGKMQTKKVAGYSTTLEGLWRSFAQHKFRNSEATTVKELLTELKQAEQDLGELKKTALKEDFKMLRQTAKTIKEINKDG